MHFLGGSERLIGVLTCGDRGAKSSEHRVSHILHDDASMVHDYVVHGGTMLVELSRHLGGIDGFGDSGVSTNIRHQESYFDHFRLTNPETVIT